MFAATRIYRNDWYWHVPQSIYSTHLVSLRSGFVAHPYTLVPAISYRNAQNRWSQYLGVILPAPGRWDNVREKLLQAVRVYTRNGSSWSRVDAASTIIPTVSSGFRIADSSDTGCGYSLFFEANQGFVLQVLSLLPYLVYWCRVLSVCAK